MARRTMFDTDADFGVIAHTPTETPPCAPGQSARPVALCLPVPPSANRYWRNMRERMVVSQEAQTYKQHVRRLCDSVDPCTGNVALQFTVFRARKAGDLDNFEKVLLDALKGILYPDDSAWSKSMHCGTMINAIPG